MPVSESPVALAGANRASNRLARRLVDTTTGLGAPAAHGILRASIAFEALDNLAVASGDPNAIDLLNVGTAPGHARGNSGSSL
jgi:hypothetical protein